MQLIDLTHPMSQDMPVYPGTEQPIFITGCTLEDDGFLEKKITLFSHTGTHIDAPAHLLKGHNTLDQLPIDHFYGSAFVIQLDGTPSSTIGVEDLEPYSATIEAVDFLLLHTGWSRYWGTQQYFSGFPVLSLEAARWLSNKGLKGVGLDNISADRADTEDFCVHKTLLAQNTLIIENLTRLEQLPQQPFDFSCLPLKIEEADGSPVRAVAITRP